MIISEKFYNTLKSELHKISVAFFDYAWDANITEWLQTESRYTKLVEWLKSETESRRKYLAVLFTDNFEQYKQHLAEFAILLQCYDIILDPKCTIAIRTDLEQKICNMCNISYSDFLNAYV